LPRADEERSRPEKYREWLRVRGVDNPSEDELKAFESSARRNPRSSVIELVLYIWMDTSVEYSGTRRWLEQQGFTDPPAEDLRYFSRKIRRTVTWRAALIVGLVAGWFVFLHAEGLRLGVLGLVFPVSGFAYGLTNVFGTKLPGHSPSRPVVRYRRESR
jgi:hypothetical protein